MIPMYNILSLQSQVSRYQQFNCIIIRPDYDIVYLKNIQVLLQTLSHSSIPTCIVHEQASQELNNS
jgi:hypothetical protein